jgi:prepilin-type N-terminal cleavage/methylation domain-containing protein
VRRQDIATRQRRIRNQKGFSLIELLITLVVLLAVSGIVLTGMYQMSMKQASVSNRADMHSSVRAVTALLQQEVSQAGRIAFPTTPYAEQYTTLQTAVVASPCPTVPPPDPLPTAVTVENTEFLFDNARLLVGVGDCEDVVTATGWDGTTFTGEFKYDHAIGELVRPAGAFAEGILPSSTGNELKMFGDINGDGDMVYVEYVCNPGTVDAPGTLTRMMTPWNTAPGGAPAPEVLIDNLVCNEDPTDCAPDTIPCFTYQQDTLNVEGTDMTFTLNVAITLSARPEFEDPQTGRIDPETKALLNVSPRNVFLAWEMATLAGTKKHVQPTPPEITDLSQ